MNIEERLKSIEYEDVAACPLCRETDKMTDLITDVQVNRPSQAWRVCLNCGHTFVSPRPTKKWLDEFYNSGYREMVYKMKESESHEKIPVASVNEERIRAMRIATIAQALKSKVANHLDIGSSTGALVAGVIDTVRPAHSWGVEPNEAWRQFSKDAFSNRNSAELLYEDDAHFVKTLGEVPKTSKFELVTIIHTIEHLLEPRDVLEQCHSRMRPSGVVIVEAPNRYGGVANPLLWPHLHCFTIETLDRLLRTAGFYPILFETYGNHPPLFPPPQSILVAAAMVEQEISVDSVLSRYNMYRQTIGFVQQRAAEIRPKYDVG